MTSLTDTDYGDPSVLYANAAATGTCMRPGCRNGTDGGAHYCPVHAGTTRALFADDPAPYARRTMRPASIQGSPVARVVTVVDLPLAGRLPRRPRVDRRG
jgi:hypothetical protein